MSREKQHSLDDRVIAALAKRRHFTTKALKLLRRTREQLSLAIGLVLMKLRESGEPVQALQEQKLLVQQLTEENEYLRSRLSRIPSKERAHYTPDERYRILLHQSTYVLSLTETAERFLLAPRTIARWLRESETEPEKKTVGSLLKASPPCMRYAEVVRELVHVMDRFGFGGSKRIAQTLARAGWKLSRETVRRWRKTHGKDSPSEQHSPSTLKASYPNHVWMMDLTRIESLFKLISFRLVVLLDVFSRLPLAARLFVGEPSARDVAELFRKAVQSCGPPKHFVSDQGSQFRAKLFSRILARRGVKQRFGAIGKPGSIAILERFFRTLKEMLALKTRLSLSPHHLFERISVGLAYYCVLKPHQALGRATPAERYLKKTPLSAKAVRPPRVYESRASPSGLDVRFFDSEQRLPFLVEKLAA